MKHYVDIQGVVETTSSHSKWLDAFINWLESRGEIFGGSTTPVDEDGQPIQE